MPQNYRGFDINDATTPAPWGTRETLMNQNLIDTVLADSIQGTNDPTGVKFNKLYSPDNTNVKINVQSEDLVTINSDATIALSANNEIFLQGTSSSNIDIISDEININAARINLNASNAPNGINVPTQTPIQFGDANSYAKYDGNELHLKGRQGVTIDNLNNQQFVGTDVNGKLYQGPIDTDFNNYVNIPLGVQLNFDNSYNATQLHHVGISSDTTHCMTIQATDNTDSQLNLFVGEGGGCASYDSYLTMSKNSINFQAQSGFNGASISLDRDAQINGSEILIDATAVRIGDNSIPLYPLELKLPTTDVKFLDASNFPIGTMLTGASGWIKILINQPGCGYQQMYLPIYQSVGP